MKTILAIIIVYSYILSSCTINPKSKDPNKQNHKPDKIEVSISNEIFTIDLKEVDGIDALVQDIVIESNRGVSNGVTFKEIVGQILRIDISNVKIDNEYLKYKDFSFSFFQKQVDSAQNLMLLDTIVKSLNLSSEIKTINIDCNSVSITDKSKYLSYLNKSAENKSRDSFHLDKDSIIFKNITLESIVEKLDKEFSHKIYYNGNSKDRINYSMARELSEKQKATDRIGWKLLPEEWDYIKSKMKIDLGLDFDVYKIPNLICQIK